MKVAGYPLLEEYLRRVLPSPRQRWDNEYAAWWAEAAIGCEIILGGLFRPSGVGDPCNRFWGYGAKLTMDRWAEADQMAMMAKATTVSEILMSASKDLEISQRICEDLKDDIGRRFARLNRQRTKHGLEPIKVVTI